MLETSPIIVVLYFPRMSLWFFSSCPLFPSFCTLQSRPQNSDRVETFQYSYKGIPQLAVVLLLLYCTLY